MGWIPYAAAAAQTALTYLSQDQAAKAARLQRKQARIRNYNEANQAIEQYYQITGDILNTAAASEQLGSSTVQGALASASGDTLSTLTYIKRMQHLGLTADAAMQLSNTYGVESRAVGVWGEIAHNWVAGWNKPPPSFDMGYQISTDQSPGAYSQGTING